MWLLVTESSHRQNDNLVTIYIVIPSVNFINVLRKNFSYERHFGSLESCFEQTFVRKMPAKKNVDEIDGRSQSYEFSTIEWEKDISCA